MYGSNQTIQLDIFSITSGRNGQIQPLVPMDEDTINFVLQNGGNDKNLRIKIVSEFAKNKTDKEIALFLKTHYKGGNGFLINNKNICAYYSKDGIHLSNTNTARYNPQEIISWERAVATIKNLLNKGIYASQIEIDKSLDFEIKTLAEKLCYLNRDLNESYNELYLTSLNTPNVYGFPEQMEIIINRLEDVSYRKKIRIEYNAFLNDYQQNHSILRFHYHKLNNIKSRLADLEIPRKNYTSKIKYINPYSGFITDDEIELTLNRGSGVRNGKKRIYNFFSETHSLKEQISFLKNEYGIGGCTCALMYENGMNEMHDGKGVKYTKINDESIQLSWSKVATIINRLIIENKYNINERN